MWVRAGDVVIDTASGCRLQPVRKVKSEGMGMEVFVRVWFGPGDSRNYDIGPIKSGHKSIIMDEVYNRILFSDGAGIDLTTYLENRS